MQRRLPAVLTFLALTASLGAAAPVSAATVISDPAKFVTAIYARLAKGGDYAPPEDIYTPRLKALWALEQHETPKGDVGRIDFDFWINGQDGSPSAVKIKADPVEGNANRRIVEVTFVNTKPQTEQFYFERVAGAWKLDDVISTTPGESWTLSVILKYGFAG